MSAVPAEKSEPSSSSNDSRDSFSEGDDTEQKKPLVKNNQSKASCRECHSKLNVVQTVSIPEDTVDEEVALVTLPEDKPDGGMAPDDLSVAPEEDDDYLVCRSVANAKFYCKEGHLCALDSGIIERDKHLFMSGYMKLLNSENADLTGGIQIDKSHCIVEWFIKGLGTKDLSIHVTSDVCNYRILSVAKEYEDHFAPLLNLVHYTNHFIRCLLESDGMQLDEIIDSFVPSGDMQHLLERPSRQSFLDNNAQFIVDHLTEYMNEVDADGVSDDYLLESDSFTEFLDLSGIVSRPANVKKVSKSRNNKSKVKPSGTKATTTPLVCDMFNHLFEHQMSANLDQTKLAANQSKESINAEFLNLMKAAPRGKRSVDFGPTKFYYYGRQVTDWCKVKTVSGAVTHEFELRPGTFVAFEEEERTEKRVALDKPYLGQVRYLQIDKERKVWAHVQFFMKSYESVLNDLSDIREIFAADQCAAVPVEGIKAILPVLHKQDYDRMENNEGYYYYHMQHCLVSGAFTSVPNGVAKDLKHACSCCQSRVEEYEKSRVQFNGDHFSYNGQVYSKGSCVLLRDLNFDCPESSEDEDYTLDTDEKEYTEAFRKDSASSRVQTKERPLAICQILTILPSNSDDESFPPNKVDLVVRLLRRPRETKAEGTWMACPHKVYYTDEEYEVTVENVMGIAHVAYLGNIHKHLVSWCVGGDTRFYFSDKHDFESVKFEDVPESAKKMMGAINPKTGEHINAPDHKKLFHKLRTLDLFAGCGGLSRGLHDAGLCKTKWACEFDQDAADAFKKNFVDTTVFTEDINSWFEQIKQGKTKDAQGQSFPRKGEVDFIVGGPPCQGFSSMNRFGARECAAFKNSLVTTYFSLVDYFRPKFFLFENVKTFATNSDNIYLRSSIACCLKMGYQIRFGILQAGSYGVPQSRHRTIIIGALPGYELPSFPQVTHLFDLPTNTLTVQGTTIDPGCSYGDMKERMAPYPAVTVMDALSDLPDIISGEHGDPVNYLEACSTYQKILRRNCTELTEHVARPISPLDLTRIKFVPYLGDWRDIPNIAYKLPDGSVTDVLEYYEEDGKKGVCPCNLASKGKSKQCVKPTCRNFLIPWCLPHTADRHAQWRGLYGRLDLKKCFSTTVTAPEPMGKQGRVVHPYYNRCISIKEAARSQGFPDSFKLSGDIRCRYRQVGNAVPPPLAKRIGLEIVKSLHRPEEL